jgi:hypothetical protein
MKLQLNDFATRSVVLRRSIERHQQWIEQTLGVPLAESVILETGSNLAQVGIEKILEHTSPNYVTSREIRRLRPLVAKAELPLGFPPLIGHGGTHAKLDLRAALLEEKSRKATSRLEWMDCPVALHLHTIAAPVVAMNVSFFNGPGSDDENQTAILVARRNCYPQVVHLLEDIGRMGRTPQLHILHGGTQRVEHCRWDDLVLDPGVVSLLKNDFENFWVREPWFREKRLPFRRGYLLHGPPGNGKTTAIRAMMSSRGLTAYTLRFFDSRIDDNDLDSLFERALDNRPSIVLFEDLDRAFPKTGETRSNISLQQLLNSLDGVGSGEGIVVVATANEPAILDPAILRRPGRFDRVVHFPNPGSDLRCEYFQRLNPTFAPDDLGAVTQESTGFSFAQLRETYVMAGQRAFERNDEIQADDLLSGIRSLRKGFLHGSNRNGSAGFHPQPKE